MKASLAALFVVAHAPLAAQTTEHLSITYNGLEPQGSCVGAVISADGTRVAFKSTASNILPGYSGSQIYVRDLVYGVTLIASVSPGGAGSNFGSSHPSISADGRYVAFDSPATNLAPDTTADQDVFVHDMSTGTTELVSADAFGMQESLGSGTPVISADGRFVAFASRCDFFLPGDGNGIGHDIFLKDRVSGTIERISASEAGLGGNGDSGDYLNTFRGIAMTPDARFVAFVSLATNLVPGDTNGRADVFLRDRQLGTVRRVNLAAGGVQVNGGASYSTSISADGRFVAFDSGSSDFTPLDTDGGTVDVFVHDVQLGLTTQVSQATGGVLDISSYYPSISADGRRVAFQNGAVLAHLCHIWTRDLQTGSAELISQTTGGAPGSGSSTLPSISADGSRVAFPSYSENLSPPTSQVFFERAFLRSNQDYTSFCFGDGTGTPCPCGNESAIGQGQGCRHSLGTGGKLAAIGTSNATADSFLLVGSSLPDSSGLFFQGTTRMNGGLGSPFGDGLRCAGGTITRLSIKPITGGVARYPEAGDTPISVLAALSPGDVRTYQLWYRNAASFCTDATFNLTNAIEATW